jgi:hypothetical protein
MTWLLVHLEKTKERPRIDFSTRSAPWFNYRILVSLGFPYLLGCSLIKLKLDLDVMYGLLPLFTPPQIMLKNAYRQNGAGFIRPGNLLLGDRFGKMINVPIPLFGSTP